MFRFSNDLNQYISAYDIKRHDQYIQPNKHEKQHQQCLINQAIYEACIYDHSKKI